MRAGDADALAGAVIRLLQDRELATTMAARGRELVKERFAEALMVQRIDALYRRLVAARGSG